MKKYIAAFIGAIFLVSCGNKKTEENKDAETKNINIIKLSSEQIKNAGLESGNPTLKNVKEILQLQGTVTVLPKSVISISIPLGGYVKSTNLIAGMNVQKGQVLAVLEDMQFIELQQDYLMAKEKFELAQNEHKRQKELNLNKAASDKVLEQITTEMRTQRITMSSLEQKLNLLGINAKALNVNNISKTIKVVSPINGLVSKVNINIGKYVNPTDMLFELIDKKDIVLTLNAFEKDVASLSVGQNVTVYANASDAKKYGAKIAFINQSLNGDRAAEIICKVNTYNPALLPGLFVNAEVEIENQKALTVPEDAVVRWEGKFYVFTELGNNQFQMIEVKSGVKNEGYNQIISDAVSSSSKLVIKNAYTLLMSAMNNDEQ
ncbi:efflux RND transporter periplasmic adaptor subunit [Flavobacterium nitrogenifigens]|uniref:Membrane fusion protein, cobalt-zinc-cadmium efflux system n=1 Tax=Flavobacterium nitrogenifigens TaxID=1617283 RepID=A0A521F3E3_9FLAO|nr:efflux RND transporter periplasmic adaptor subunit [Flavobacterium nitrogenifigens]KAF2339696.1 efflux RND transporter periplasmic adaptor subunit [Flavobacterium nitrogenifigens]SMO90714.1 membrane fusion protein, cobalt-zinc-cadmium efflux system [Flavobacterium nitrogenifigens]